MNDNAKAVRLQVDTREQNTRVVKYWNSMGGLFPGLQLEFLELDCGDYLLGASVAVERKSPTDFMLSVMDQHVYGDLARLKARFERIIYIVEGDIHAARFHSDPAALRAALSYMVVVEGVAIVPSPSAEDTAQLLYAMAFNHQHGAADSVSLHPDKPRDLASSRLYLVEALPGVGAQRAHLLLKHFGSVQRIFSASSEELQQAGELSPQAAQRIRTVLEAP
ncbi:MAG: ERCC4 domain-containing protein [Burkholderiales bacterium]